MKVLESAPAQTIVVSTVRDLLLPRPKPYDQTVTIIYGPEPITVRPPVGTSICDKRGTTGDYVKSDTMSRIPSQSMVVFQCAGENDVWSIIYQSASWVFAKDVPNRGQELADGTWYMPSAEATSDVRE